MASRLARASLLGGLGALVLAGCAREPDPEPPRAPEVKHVEPVPVHRSGRWHRTMDAGEAELTGEQRSTIAELEAIGYASGTTPRPSRSGVTLHERERAHEGLNLYSSGHAACAVLMDMDGRALHSWRADFTRIWPDEKLRGRNRALTWFWRWVYLYENGDLLAVFEGHSLVKLDKDSNVLWKSHCGAHHDLAVLPSGDIVVLTRKAQVVPAIDDETPVLEDFISILGPDGVEKSRLSLLEALDRSPFQALWQDVRARRGDVLHTNALDVLDGTAADAVPAFRAGNLLVSSRALSFLAVVDPVRGAVEWTLQGSFRGQHDPRLLPNGHLLLFDNCGRGEASTVVELDPASGRTLWEYRGTAASPFYSRFCGTAERLANGNTLITESDRGRAFEVTPAGEIVWEFWNPERAGDDRELIASLFTVVRLEPGYAAFLTP